MSKPSVKHVAIAKPDSEMVPAGAVRRKPQQDRGERRVAEVLEAAASVIAEVGYEAATMTTVAERAGASIGTVYQYFPNKDAIVTALRLQYANEMRACWTPLAETGAELGVTELVDRIFATLTEFMERRPAYIPLLNAPRMFKRDEAARNRLRGHFADLFRRKQPKLTPEAALRVANVALQIVKGMNPVYAEAKANERAELLAEFKLVLAGYLRSRLSDEEG